MTTTRGNRLVSLPRAGSVAVAAAVLAVTAAVPGPPAGAATAAAPGGTFYVQSAVNGLNASDSGGTVALHQPKGNEDRQQWTAVAVSGGQELRSTDDTAHCLGRSGADAAIVACGAASAAWEVSAAGDGTYTLGVPGTADRLTLGDAPSGGVHPERPRVGAAGPLSRWYLTPAPLPRTAMPPADARTLDQVTFLTAHNAYANGVDGGFAPPFVNLFPNQSRGISQQLADGVRGFMMDIHQTPDGAILCHNSCTLVSRPVALWVDLQRMVDFLRQHPGQFVTVFLEDYVSPEVLRSELSRVNGLYDVLYRPDEDGVREHGWPAMGDLAARGKQLMIFSDRTRGSDTGLRRDSYGVMYQQEWTVENYWSMGSGAGTSDWSCYSRWYGAGVNVPLTREESGFRPLFVMNHFRDTTLAGTASTDNGKLLNRVQNFCEPAARKKPTYVAVDRYDLGSPNSAVDQLNSYTVVP